MPPHRHLFFNHIHLIIYLPFLSSSLSCRLTPRPMLLSSSPNILSLHFFDSDQPNYLPHPLLHYNYSHHSRSHTNTSNGDTKNFLNLHSSALSDSAEAASRRSILRPDHTHVIDNEAAGNSLLDGAALSQDSAHLNMASGNNPKAKSEVAVEDGEERSLKWENATSKAENLAHLLYEQLLLAHMACLWVATPVDQLPRIDTQLAQSENVVAKYLALGHGAHSMVADEKRLDQFMVSSINLCHLFVKNSTLFMEKFLRYK